MVKAAPVIFGEVLFDCFPGEDYRLGGAPFNVAWHLQALGDQPLFVSRVGEDRLGAKIRQAMRDWGMNTDYLQQDSLRATGQVQVEFADNEPQYDIKADCAYDFIAPAALPAHTGGRLLYHGSLALRNPQSRLSLQTMLEQDTMPVFMDVNLRQPWWQRDEVLRWMKRASWLKLNEGELTLLYGSGDVANLMQRCCEENDLEFVVVTQGERGATALTKAGEWLTAKPQAAIAIVDSVGAGDAFAAMLLHGLLNDWPLEKSMQYAQMLASAIVGQRGATPVDKSFYNEFL